MVLHFQTELIGYLPLTNGLILWSNFYNNLFVFIKTFYLGDIWYFTVFGYFNMLLLKVLLTLSVLRSPNCSVTPEHYLLVLVLFYVLHRLLLELILFKVKFYTQIYHVAALLVTFFKDSIVIYLEMHT